MAGSALTTVSSTPSSSLTSPGSYHASEEFAGPPFACPEFIYGSLGTNADGAVFAWVGMGMSSFSFGFLRISGLGEAERQDEEAWNDLRVCHIIEPEFS